MPFPAYVYIIVPRYAGNPRYHGFDDVIAFAAIPVITEIVIYSTQRAAELRLYVQCM